MEGKWIIADRDLNEREGLKWLLKSSSIPVSNIFLASNFQEFVVCFERETPKVVLMELDMITRDEWSTFRDLLKIYDPILLLTSAEATFEKARMAIDMQALDLMIKPFSTTKVKTAYQNAYRRFVTKNHANGIFYQNSYQNISYESLFISQHPDSENYNLAAFQTESTEMVGTLYSFLSDYPFKDKAEVLALSNMVVVLFKNTFQYITEQCQKALSKWEEEFTDPLAIMVHIGESPTLNQKYLQIQKMLSFTYYNGYSRIIEFDSLPDLVHIDPFLTPPEQREWIEMLSSNDIEKIKTWLYEEFLHLQDPFPDPGLVRIRLTSILAQIRRYMKTHNLNEQQSYEMAYIYIFNSILYDTVLYRTVQNLILFIQKLFHAAEIHNKNIKQDPIDRGISFMRVNYSNSVLKLDDVAQYVDRNPSYFSHLLISKTGTGFTEILKGIRMKEARHLLKETTKPIKEISNLVGYHQSNYFSRMFKEFTGMSPKEFRTQQAQSR